jgi:hypothetical protein
MIDVKCAECSAVLTSRELREGWCDSCGTRVPMFVYHQAGLNAPREKVLMRAQAAPVVVEELGPEEKPALWQLGLIGLAIVVVAVVIVLALI